MYAAFGIGQSLLTPHEFFRVPEKQAPLFSAKKLVVSDSPLPRALPKPAASIAAARRAPAVTASFNAYRLRYASCMPLLALLYVSWHHSSWASTLTHADQHRFSTPATGSCAIEKITQVFEENSKFECVSLEADLYVPPRLQ